MGNCFIKQNIYTNEPNLANLAESTFDIPEYSLKNLFIEGKVVNVYDGDTVHVVFSLNGNLVKYNCRLLGIDSPEICPKNVPDKTKRDQEISAAVKSRNYLITQVTGTEPPNDLTKKSIKEFCGKAKKLVWVKCYDFDKYGRLLVEIFLDKTDSLSINKQMVNKKLAVEYDGGTKKEFKPIETLDIEV